MKTAASLLALSGLLAAAVSAGAAVVGESEAEFFASGDFDGDARLDVVVIDKETGTYRIGYQLAAEVLTWSPPRTSGLGGLTGAAVGRFFNASQDALAFTEPAASRVAMMAAANPAAATAAVERFPDALGSTVLAGVDVPLLGNNPAITDLFIGAQLGAALAPDVVTVMRPDGNSPLLMPADAGAPLRRANPVKLKSTLIEMPAVLAGAGGEAAEFRVYELSGDPPHVLFATGGIAPGSDYIVERFAPANPLAQVLFYTPGSPLLRRRQVTEPVAGTFAAAAETVFTLGAPISQVVVLPDPSGPRLLVLFDDGASAAVMGFDGVTAPSTLLAIAAPGGRRFSGAGVLGGGHFLLASGAASVRRSDSFHRYHRDASGNYQAAPVAQLPFVGTHTGRANVLFFAREPFVSADPGLVGLRLTPDWATGFNLQATSVSVEAFAGGVTGLTSPQSTSLAPLPAGASFILPNQFRADASVFNFKGGSAADVATVAANPPAGFYQNSVKVTLAASNPGAQIWYRQGASGDWAPYATPVTLALDTELQFYALASSRSAVFSASYQFADGGLGADTDGDGVPDFVEIAKGLNPAGGRDTDGDGVSDLQELLAGTDPGSPTSYPAMPPAVPGSRGLDLDVTPSFYSAFAVQPDWRASGVPVGVFTPGGDPVASGPVASFVVPPPANEISQARLTGVALPHAPFFAVGTPASFDLTTPSPDPRAASELATLATAPAPDGNGLDYLPENRPLADEAAAWIAALQDLAAADSTPQLDVSLSPAQTLVALLLEAKIRLILGQRGIPGAALADVFPFRSAGASANRISPQTLAGLAQVDGAGHPAYDLAAALASLRASVSTSANPGVQNLRNLAIDAYQVFENSLPANSPGSTALGSAPIEILRVFLAGQPLPADYLARTALSSAQRSSAATAVGSLLSGISPRPQVTVALTVLQDSFGPLVTRLRSGAGQSYALIDDGGRPWRYPGAISPPPGSLLSVTGFTDLTNPAPSLANSALGVIGVEIVSFPVAAPDDSDGDGLPDSWEHALLGGLAARPGDDPDGDGLTNAQELALGTDPNDDCSPLPGGVVPFAPELYIAALPGSNAVLFWDYPEDQAHAVTFTIQMSGDLVSWPDAPQPITNPSPGRYQIEVPIAAPRRFYRLVVTAL